jgi:hypothetical protein
VANAPQEKRALLERLLCVQQRDGSAMLQFNPLTKVANAGDSREVRMATLLCDDQPLDRLRRDRLSEGDRRLAFLTRCTLLQTRQA